MKTTICTCDICNGKKGVKEIGLQVIFTTEQNEGRKCKPYLETQKIDVCLECLQKIFRGNYVYASGAMGGNKYEFKSLICNDGK